MNLSQQIKIIMFAGFLLALHSALVTYINSSFLSLFVSEKTVGLIYILSSSAAILSLLIIPKLFSLLGGYRFLIISSLLMAFALFLLSALKTPAYIIPVFILYFALSNLVFFALDELLQIFSKHASTGKLRGFYLTSINLAWVLSQAASSRILVDSDFQTLYFIAFMIMILFFLISLFCLKGIPDPKYDKLTPFKSIGEFSKNKNLVRSYGINFLLQFFYSWMVIYTPIYLSKHLGFSWSEISSIFTVMLISFVLIQIPLGRHSDKVGERGMLMSGFFIAGLATISLFFITKHEVWIWALLLFMTRIGAATIEIMSDVYFFKHIRKENDEFISIYRNTGPMAYIISPLCAFILFYFLPSPKFIFPVLGAMMLFGVYLASTIKKSDI